MKRKIDNNILLLASHNQGKIKEIKNILAILPLKIITAAELSITEPIEDSQTYVANALIKAKACAIAANMPALADDAGIEVLALDNKPGVDTAPYTKKMGGREKVFALWEKNELIITNPKARFIAVSLIAWPDGYYEFFQGVIDGKLSFPPKGDHGFGYDPIFIPDGAHKTMAEMSAIEKNNYSHRYLALKGLFDL